MQVGQIFPGTPEWNYSQFRLQLILSQPNIEITSISKNAKAQNHFAQKQSYFKIDAAIDVTEENAGQINYFKSNTKKGIVFKCGRINQECNFLDGMGSPKLYRILLFKIAVKDVLPIYNSSSISKQDLLHFTEQYDSIYISTPKQEMSVYDHQYFLKSQSQYVWQYDIQYRYINANQPGSKVRRWIPDSQKCQECQTQKAYWYCIDEKQIFCRQCYQDAHKGKNRAAHKKQPISPFNCHKKCQRVAHNQNILEFYCFNCKGLKCNKCLADTAHTIFNRNSSNFEKSSMSRQSEQVKSRKSAHEFVQVGELIRTFRQKQKQLNSELKGKLSTRIKQIQAVISAMSRNYEQKMLKLQHNLTIEIAKLRKQSMKQVNRAVSIHLQLKRKFDQILWIQKFVQYNEQALDAEGNIRIKEAFASFVGYMNAEEYFLRIQQKIIEMRKIT